MPLNPYVTVDAQNPNSAMQMDFASMLRPQQQQPQQPQQPGQQPQQQQGLAQLLLQWLKNGRQAGMQGAVPPSAPSLDQSAIDRSVNTQMPSAPVPMAGTQAPDVNSNYRSMSVSPDYSSGASADYPTRPMRYNDLYDYILRTPRLEQQFFGQPNTP